MTDKLEDIYVQFRLMIRDSIKSAKFYYTIVYTPFAYMQAGGGIQSFQAIKFTGEFKPNPKQNEKGWLAVDTSEFLLFDKAKAKHAVKLLGTLNDRSGRAFISIHQQTNKGIITIAEHKSINWIYRHEAKVIRNYWEVTKGLNSTNPDTQKKANINPYPFIIARSKNTLFAEDSHHAKGKKLPAKFSTRDGTLYTMTKDKLLQELLNLMAWGAIGTNEVVAKDLATKFVNNKIYSITNTYTHPTLVNTIRNSKEFKNYVKNTSSDIKEFIKKSNFKITPNELLVKTEIDRLYFDGGKYYQNYWGTGLGITLHQISYIEIELNNVIHQAGKPDKLITTFILYDTFGLDTLDLEKYGILNPFSKDAWNTFGERDVRGKGISTGLGWGLIVGGHCNFIMTVCQY